MHPLCLHKKTVILVPLKDVEKSKLMTLKEHYNEMKKNLEKYDYNNFKDF